MWIKSYDLLTMVNIKDIHLFEVHGVYRNVYSTDPEFYRVSGYFRERVAPAVILWESEDIDECKDFLEDLRRNLEKHNG